MNRNTLIVAIMTLFTVVSMAAFAGCDEDGDTTAQDLCYKLADAYCSHGAGLACGDYSSCYSTRGAMCKTMFDNTCKATQANKDKIDHDIEMIIEPMSSCGGLGSIETYLDQTLADMATSCQSSNTTGMDIGLMCENLIASICAKVQTLGCDPSVTLTQCESNLMSSGVMIISDHSCVSGGDHTAATSAQKTAYDAMMAEVSNATTCAEFGY